MEILITKEKLIKNVNILFDNIGWDIHLLSNFFDLFQIYTDKKTCNTS